MSRDAASRDAATRLALDSLRGDRRLGSGCHGTVYLVPSAKIRPLARFAEFRNMTPTRALVAVKVSSRKEGLREEARVLSRVAKTRARGVVPRFYFSADVGHLYVLVMEHVRGEVLEEWSLDGPTLAKLRSAVYLLNRYGRVEHGDLRGQNVIVTPSGAVKIIDFGICRASTAAYRDTAAFLAAIDAAIDFRTGPRNLWQLRAWKRDVDGRRAAGR